RAERLHINSERLQVIADTDLDHILEQAEAMTPSLLVIDSIQTMYTGDIDAAPGSVSQVRECTSRLLRFCKERNIPTVIIGHVTKEGNIAGPRMLEHMVDVVLYFEGERSYQFRILRSIKNRFGSTSETGIFAMVEEGLQELSNPSASLLAERSDEESGSAVMIYLEGVRPILVEVQSLVVTTAFGMPRRTAIGYDLNRLIVLLAVLEKRCGFTLGNKDVYVNVIGGLKVNEPACDLSMAVAIVSNLKNRIVPTDMVILGEVGLTGNVRSIPRIEQRINEAKKLGFKKFIIPEGNYKQIKDNDSSIKIRGVKSIQEAMQLVFS
ncbi:MAG: DNA repair protein RadA, partial [Clostridium sp.]|nr:DNA repair protein RadA [Clostridium sp.]